MISKENIKSMLTEINLETSFSDDELNKLYTIINENKKTIQIPQKINSSQLRQSRHRGHLKAVNLKNCYTGGTSKKLSNLNWKNILSLSLQSCLGETTIIETHLIETLFTKGISTILLLIYLINELNKMSEVTISKEDGLLLWIIHTLTFHESYNITGQATIDVIKKYYDELQIRYNLAVFSQATIIERLSALEKLKCIEKTGDMWETVEIVMVREKV